MSVTVGIDLASQAKRTAIAVVRWDSRPELVQLSLGDDVWGTTLTDKTIYNTAIGMIGETGETVSKVGIDAPFGWPRPFVDALAGYASGAPWPTRMDDDLKPFHRRTTDRLVRDRANVNPLAVSVDRIGYCAMRCAGLLATIAEFHPGGPAAAARDGSGLVCEVYPDPALRHFALGSSAELQTRESYKGPEKVQRRAQLLEVLVTGLDLQDPAGLLDRARAAAEDDYLDALLCALVARACDVGATTLPTASELDDALLEGWIHLPTGTLAGLVTG